MLGGAVSKVQLLHCRWRGDGCRYQKVLTAPKKYSLQVVSSQGSPLGGNNQDMREISGCSTLYWQAACTLVMFIHSSSSLGEDGDTEQGDILEIQQLPLPSKGTPKEGGIVSVWNWQLQPVGHLLSP